MGKCSGCHWVAKSQFRQIVDIAPLCCQPSLYFYKLGAGCQLRLIDNPDGCSRW